MSPDLLQALTLAVTQIFLGGIYVVLLVEFRQPVRIWRLRWLALVSGIVAASVAFVGTIGFIRLVIPHIFRLILGPDNRLILPISTLGGAAFIIMCDYVAHAVAPYYGVLPIGVVTSLIGAPFFVYLLVSRRKEVGW